MDTREIAEKIVTDWLTEFAPLVRATTVLIPEIESAMTTAQKELAQKMIDSVRRAAPDSLRAMDMLLAVARDAGIEVE